MAKGLVAGVVAGVVGAVVWAAVAYYANLEVGYLAWGIGLLVGLAVAAMGARGPVAGGAAALITIVSLLAGKYLSVEMLIQKELGGVTPVSEELLISYVADSVVSDIEEQGGKVAWPSGVDPEYAAAESDYPKEVWSQADEQWSSMAEEDQQALREYAQQNADAGEAAWANEARQNGFLATFSPFDLVFFGLGVVTAFRIPNSAEEA